MTLAGTRPPTVDEWDKYELHHRARLLYLDESEFKRSMTFAIAGIAIKKDNIGLLEKEMAEVKKIIWDEEYITLNNPILHCTELEKVFVKRKSDDIIGFRPEYQELKKRKSEDIEKIYEFYYYSSCR